MYPKGDPIWISVALAQAIHARQLAEHGGQDGTRDVGLLESAMARPRHRFAHVDPTPSIAELAASYAYGVSRNHPFIDGSKRTATVVAETSMNLNGFDLTASDSDLTLTMLALAAGDLTEDQLIAWFEANAKPSR